MSFTSYVEKMLKDVDEDDTCEIQLPIKEINNIPVDCILKIDLAEQSSDINIYYKFFGTADKAWQEPLINISLEPETSVEDEYITFVTKDGKINLPEEFLAKVKSITKLKFDHFHGRFTFDEIEDNSFLKEVFECENVKLDFDECMVCYRNTKNTTSCNHYLCLECWAKLPTTCNCCKTGRKCPSCRKDRIERCIVVCEECEECD